MPISVIQKKKDPNLGIPCGCTLLSLPKFVRRNCKNMKARIPRICIYTKDVQCITGKSERYSRDLIHKIKKSLHKEAHQALTVAEFCAYMGIPYDSIQDLIIN